MNDILEIPEWHIDNLEISLAISLFAAGYITYYFISHSEKILDRYQAKFGQVQGLTQFIWMSRYLGALLIGFIPMLIMTTITGKSLAFYGLGFANSSLSLAWVFGLLIPVIPITYVNARKAESYAFYPFVREKNWTRQMVFQNALSWIIYLFGYELMFRGILLFSTISVMGIWPAIVLNTALYALVHMPKSLKETISAVPFGVILCLITLTTGTFWVAFVVHCGLALGTFLFSLKFNPEMKIV